MLRHDPVLDQPGQELPGGQMLPGFCGLPRTRQRQSV
jgi:hypothetical protein